MSEPVGGTVDARQVAPFRIVPTEGTIGVYSNTMIDNPYGAVIDGQFSLLLMPGTQVRQGTLHAAPKAKALTVCLSGAYVPGGIDLKNLEIGHTFAGQGLRTEYLKMGGTNYIYHLDVSLANMGVLDISSTGVTNSYGSSDKVYTDLPFSTDMSGGVFGTLNFGRTFGRNVFRLNLENTTIDNVEGRFPEETRGIQINENTHLPENFMIYLTKAREAEAARKADINEQR